MFQLQYSSRQGSSANDGSVSYPKIFISVTLHFCEEAGPIMGISSELERSERSELAVLFLMFPIHVIS